jgi:KaiC/GvpD/RAD55 family RecA-like ATPase
MMEASKLYTELVEKNIGNRGNIVELSQLKIGRANYERYCSLFSYDESIVHHIQSTGSMSNYSAPVSIRTIWVDFDHEESLEDVLREVVKFVDYLCDKYDLTRDQVPIYFSGGKGFHVGISSKLLGLDGVFEQELPEKIKAFVEHITQGIKYVDYVIYNSTRIFRLPFSVNMKGDKLFKIYLPYDIASSISVQELRQQAFECRIYPMPRPEYQENSKMIMDYMNVSANVKPTTNGVVKHNVSQQSVAKKSTATSIFKVPEQGKRNDTLFKQAFRLFSISDLKVNEVNDLMNVMYRQTIAQTGDLPHREFAMLINSAYTRSKGVGLGTDINLKSMESLTYEVFDIVSKSDCVATFIPQIDEDLGGGLKLGNLYPFIGKSGSKKSMLAQEIAIKSAMKGEPVLYFNMEMSYVELFRRTVKRVMDRDIYEEIRSGRMTEADMPMLQEELSNALKRNFYAVDNADLTVEQMTKLVTKIEEDSGKKVKLAVIDSMNSMKTHGGNETFTAFENTKKLKEFAKETMCATIMINHVTQSCQGHIRDVSLFVRGGAKVIDNCDAWFGFSKCIDKIESVVTGDNPDIVYLNDIMYLRFYNKRESGATIDSILKLNDNLSVDYLPHEPKDYEV